MFSVIDDFFNLFADDIHRMCARSCIVVIQIGRCSSGMNIDSGLGMDGLGDDARDIWDIKLIEGVRYPVIDDRFIAWIGINDF